MFEKFFKVFQVKDIRNKILYVLAMMVVFRLAAHLPVPGVNVEQLRIFFNNNEFFGLLNIFSGGGLSSLSVVMLGVGPYITASIIMQLLTMIFPSVKELYHESGEAGRQKFNQYSRIITVPLALLQGYAMIRLFQSQNILDPAMPTSVLISTLVVVVAGTVFLMWLGELMSEQNIGNGVSLIIFAGIVSRIPQVIQQEVVKYDVSKIPQYIALLVLSVVVIGGVVLITEAQRNIPVTYAKRVRGNKMFGGVSTYLPLKVNSAGMIPIIFAVSIMLFPRMISAFLEAALRSSVKYQWLANTATGVSNLLSDPVWNIVIYFVLVVLFTFFYTAVVFEPHAVAENLQKQGGFIPGIRPGNPTRDYLSYIINRITLAGAVFLGILAVLPNIVQLYTGDKNLVIGGAAVLIVVGVVLDTMRQVESQMLTQDYERY